MGGACRLAGACLRARRCGSCGSSDSCATAIVVPGRCAADDQGEGDRGGCCGGGVSRSEESRVEPMRRREHREPGDDHQGAAGDQPARRRAKLCPAPVAAGVQEGRGDQAERCASRELNQERARRRRQKSRPVAGLIMSSSRATAARPSRPSAAASRLIRSPSWLSRTSQITRANGLRA